MRSYVESLFIKHTAELTSCQRFQSLESGEAEIDDYNTFIGNVFKTHQNSPHFLAFIYAMVPPSSAENVCHNLLEELGLEEEGGQSHPELMMALIEGAGLSDQVDNLRQGARTRLDELVNEPFMFGSLREVGLGALVEVVSFEYMLSRVSSRIARFLSTYRGISDDDLVWFTHHSEVDIQHAEEGLDTIADYVSYYEFSDEEARDIIDMSMRENVFIKRYFGIKAAAESRGMG